MSQFILCLQNCHRKLTVCVCMLLTVVASPINYANTTISVGSTLYELIADPTRPYVYASDSDNNSVLFINTSTKEVEKSISVGSRPTDMDLNIDNSLLYVAVAGGSTIAIIDLETQSALTPISLTFSPSSLASGRADRLYVSRCQVGYPDTNEIVIIDIDTKSEVDRFSGSEVHAVESDGNSIYVTDGCGYSFPNLQKWDISTDTPTVIQEGNLWGGGCNSSAKLQLKLSPDDSKMYLVSGRSTCSANNDGIIPVFNSSTFVKTGELLLEYSPIAIALDASGNTAYTAHFDTVVNATPRDRHNIFRKDIHIFNTETYTESPYLATSDFVSSYGIQVTPDDKQLFAIVGASPNQDIEAICLLDCPVIVDESSIFILKTKDGKVVAIYF